MTGTNAAWDRFLALWRTYRATGTPEDYTAAMGAKSDYNAQVHAGCWSIASGDYGPGVSAMIGERVRRRP